MSGGYTCVKGRQLPYQMYGPERLWQSQQRQPDGSFAPIPTVQALDEIADRLRDIIARHGPRAVATYSGTAAFNNSVALPVIRAWHQGIGSPSNYSTLTIDQPAKIIAAVRHGVWGGGGHTFAEADVALSIGNNPIVSSLTLPGGPPGTNPVKSVADAKRRGMKLICIDPRRTELARRADLHLQIHPGEDATLLAGMLRVILTEDLYDAAFLRREHGRDSRCCALRSRVSRQTTSRHAPASPPIRCALRRVCSPPDRAATPPPVPDPTWAPIPASFSTSSRR